MAGKRRHWKEKDGRFWARIAIPVALRPFFDNKSQLTEALGGDLKIADRSHAAAVARLQSQLENARRALASGHNEADELSDDTPLSEEDIHRAAWNHYQSELARIEKKRASMPTVADLQNELSKINDHVEADGGLPERGISETFNINTDYELKAGARHFDKNLRTRRLAALRAALPDEDTRLVDATVQKFVESSQLALELGSRDRHLLSMGFLRAEIEALSRSIEVDQGMMGGVPQDPFISAPALSKQKVAAVSFRSLFDDYILSRQAAGYHRDGGANWNHAIKLFIAYLGHDDARRITQQEVLAWRTSLLAEGLSAKTVADKHLAAVRAVLRWAVEEARLEADVSAKVRQAVPKRIKAREQGFTVVEAVRLLKASVNYQPKVVDNPSNQESAHITFAKRWVPLLCAFTGARVVEITQLRRDDIQMDGDRWILRITPEAGSVKTGLYRDVPLHRQVISLGFIKCVESSKPGPLFHSAAKPHLYLKHARTTASRLSVWLRSEDLVPKEVQPSHGWRHRFKTQGRELGLSDRVIDAIQGHAGKTSGDNYGDVTLAAKVRVIDALPNYDLSV